MTKKKYNCPAEMTLDLIGGKWKVVVLWLVRKGPQRSGALKHRMRNISPAAFSLAVRDLEDKGLIRRIVHSQFPLEVSYALTARGETLSPLIKAMVKWGYENKQIYTLGSFRMEEA